ncbi:hypothetical protein Tco_0431077 [Tanacetum coccineum]
MSQDQSIPRRNKVDWHMANDDPILTTMRFIPQHKVVQNIRLPFSRLSNQIKPRKNLSVKRTYHDLATRKSGKKKKPALGLEALSVIALTEAEQMKLAIKRSKTQLHIYQPGGSGTHEGTGVTLGVPDVPTYESDDEQISWKSSEEEDDDEENVSENEDDDDDERTEFDNDGDDFVHPKFSTHDDEAKQDDEVNEEDSFDPRVQTPSHVKSTNDEDDDEEVQDVEMMDDQPTNVQTTQVTEDTHVIITPVIPEGQQQSSSVSSGFVSNILNPRPDTGIDSIFNTEATSLVDVPVTTIAEPPLVSATTLPPLPTPLITHMQKTPVPTPTIIPSSSLQDLPNFGSLFGHGYAVSSLMDTAYWFLE